MCVCVCMWWWWRGFYVWMVDWVSGWVFSRQEQQGNEADNVFASLFFQVASSAACGERAHLQALLQLRVIIVGNLLVLGHLRMKGMASRSLGHLPQDLGTH
ncbi:hypothetical protein DUNSADRAFT_4175 [Dunaliella salina]|uniref:Secreted protein n=1 Tax=Dunaliella salina TaxID=3046 RepID=A0ABQ7FUY6_DUNSA|nr:hypothetical protein DUNSADRAFT_4175 [Dunaliella salina]|eukprot:KAF5826205.1 hypothetical protein DUNSADRAFT_4175 [Dunaliella salina]